MIEISLKMCENTKEMNKYVIHFAKSWKYLKLEIEFDHSNLEWKLHMFEYLLFPGQIDVCRLQNKTI